ncbi:MAG: hypothetical protein ABI612_01190 [Betaproteobacteria bacterium]
MRIEMILRRDVRGNGGVERVRVVVSVDAAAVRLGAGAPEVLHGLVKREVLFVARNIAGAQLGALLFYLFYDGRQANNERHTYGN